MSNPYLATAFTCTNTLASTVIVGVEVFGPDGGPALNDASASSLVIASGETRTFETSPMAAFSADSNLALGIIGTASARLLVTASAKASPGVLCTAIFADGSNNPPTVMSDLAVIRKTTQQGD
jgi:hypothetical protein